MIEKGLEGSIYETIDSYYWIDDDFFSISVVVLVKVAKLSFSTFEVRNISKPNQHSFLSKSVIHSVFNARVENNLFEAF